MDLSLPPPGRRVLLAAAGVALLVRRATGAEAAQVRIDNFIFAPTPMRIPVGGSVTWTNHDDSPHSVVCLSLGVHSHPLDTGDSFNLRFEKMGTFDYICGLHPHMHGQVIVGG